MGLHPTEVMDAVDNGKTEVPAILVDVDDFNRVPSTSKTTAFNFFTSNPPLASLCLALWL